MEFVFSGCPVISFCLLNGRNRTSMRVPSRFTSQVFGKLAGSAAYSGPASGCSLVAINAVDETDIPKIQLV